MEGLGWGSSHHGATDRPRAHEGLSFVELLTATRPGEGLGGVWTSFLPPPSRALAPSATLLCVGSMWESERGWRG